MPHAVLIIGAGQLGSRYLQGLVLSTQHLEIIVVDQNSESLDVAELRWVQAGGEQSPHSIRWFNVLPAYLKRVDVAIIATSSHGRANLIEMVSSKIDVRYWVLEKVLAQSSDEVMEIQSSLARCEGAWVNTPRRMMHWHQSLHRVFSEKSIVAMLLSGGPWGLACNSIHYIDLLAWWTGQTLVSIDTSKLDNDWYESKRTGYFEITGDLIANFSGGASLKLKSRRSGRTEPIQVELDDGTYWHIDESGGKARSSVGKEVNGSIELQSQISGRMIDQIIATSTCQLPSIKTSSAMHVVFLDAMLGHWRRANNCRCRLVPIT